MMYRVALAACLSAFTVPTFAQSDPQPMRILAPAPKDNLVKVALDTDKGRIVLALDKGRAPLTTANFLAYVDKHWFDGQSFYRAFKYADGGVIQGGVRDGVKQLPPIEVEATAKTGISNKAWTIAMANGGPGATTRSDFFIMTTDIPAFDAKGADSGFAAFGHVIEGQDVVRAILAAPTSPTLGEGAMKGQMLEPAVKILKAERVKG